MSFLLKTTIVFLILFAVFAVFFSTPEEDQFARNADEGYYFKYARAVSEKGPGQFSVLLERHFQDKVAQLFPHPARIGHGAMTALWFKLFPKTFLSLARFSFFCYVLFLGVSFYYCRKLFGSDLAYLYTLVLSSNPLIMAAGRRVLQDSHLNLFWALSLWLFLDFLVNRKNRTFVLFLLAYSFTIMIKESSLTLMVFFVIAYFLYTVAYKQKISDVYLAGMCLAVPLLVGGVYVYFLGFSGLMALVKFISGIHFISQATNAYSLFGMGPWYKFIMDYLMVTPVTTLLSVGYLSHMLFARRFDAKETYFASYLVVLYALSSSLKYTKIVRFVMSLEVAVSLLSVLALFEIFRQKDKTRQLLCVFLACVGIFFVNYQNFIYLFVRWAIYDPLSYWLLMVYRIIPGLS